MEDLIIEICNEYQKKAKHLEIDISAVGARKELAKELQHRCGILEIWAINIVNGYGGKDYVAILDYKKKVGAKDTDKDK